jgi:hypothetical protein
MGWISLPLKYRIDERAFPGIKDNSTADKTCYFLIKIYI